MSSSTTAVPGSLLVGGSARRALCPACVGGRLHPYRVQVGLGGFAGYSYGEGWVAVCAGSSAELGEEEFQAAAEPCGFAMPITPY